MNNKSDREQLLQEIKETRLQVMQEYNGASQNRSSALIRTVKKVAQLNKTIFLKRFPALAALQKMRDLPEFINDKKLFNDEFKVCVKEMKENDDRVMSEAMEKDNNTAEGKDVIRNEDKGG